MNAFTIRTVDSDTDPAIRSLLTRLDAYQRSLYPPESVHSLPIAAFLDTAAALYAGYVGDRAVACGGVIIRDDDGMYGELKRLFVEPAHRGKGLAKALMAKLEAFALAANVTAIRLETGISQPEAIGLYRALGYVVRGPFGKYADDPLSVFMEKSLHQNSAGPA